jgi:hypothetical protein
VISPAFKERRRPQSDMTRSNRSRRIYPLRTISGHQFDFEGEDCIVRHHGPANALERELADRFDRYSLVNRLPNTRADEDRATFGELFGFGLEVKTSSIARPITRSRVNGLVPPTTGEVGMMSP